MDAVGERIDQQHGLAVGVSQTFEIGSVATPPTMLQTSRGSSR
jgi:hypothetical protein